MLPTLLTECSDFLIKSKGLPLIKNLPKTYEGFKKIKVRKKKNINKNFVKSFNESFTSYKDIIQRSVFANTVELCNENYEPFYIFPINKFKFMYNPVVRNTTDHYEEFFRKITSWLNEDDGKKVFSDVIKTHFNSDNLHEGLMLKSEIIIYGINYYYGIRKTLIDDYKSFIYDV